MKPFKGPAKQLGFWQAIAPFIPAAIGAVATIGGSLLSKKGAGEANVASAYQAQVNREFQEDMSRTAHQREVVDLRAAGLNPILSGTGGSGAAQPSGAMATQIDELTPAVNTGLAVRRLQQELKNMSAVEKKTKKEADLVTQHHDESETREFFMNKQNMKIDQEIKNLQTLNIGQQSENVGRGVEANLYDQTYGWLLKMAEKFGLNVSSAKSLIPKRKR